LFAGLGVPAVPNAFARRQKRINVLCRYLPPPKEQDDDLDG
jgi:hypothetical protein